jgi:hypothetical protein
MNNFTALSGVMKGGQLGLKVHTSHGTVTFLQKRKTTPDFTLGAYHPVNLTILNLNEIGREVGKKFDILIYKKETDPGTLLHFHLIMITHESSSYQAFHFFYEEIQSEFPILVTTKNLFLSLAESIAQTLNVTSCYVCGGTNIRDHWPWEAKELNPQEPFDETTPQPWGERLAPKNLYYWELLYLLSKRPILYPGGGLDLLGTKVFQ